MVKLSDKEKENALNEVRILASIRSPYIISYKEVFLTENTCTLWLFKVKLALLWNILTMEIYSKKFNNTNSKKNT